MVEPSAVVKGTALRWLIISSMEERPLRHNAAREIWVSYNTKRLWLFDTRHSQGGHSATFRGLVPPIGCRRLEAMGRYSDLKRGLPDAIFLPDSYALSSPDGWIGQCLSFRVLPVDPSIRVVGLRGPSAALEA